MSGRGRSAAKVDPAVAARTAGWQAVGAHPLFAPLTFRARLVDRGGNLCPKDGWAVVTSRGHVHAHPTRRAEAVEWAYVFAHCLLHLAFGHFEPDFVVEDKPAWNGACDAVVAEFLSVMKVGRPPPGLAGPIVLPTRTEAALYRRFRDHGVPADLRHLGTAGGQPRDMEWEQPPRWGRTDKVDWPRLFGAGLSGAVADVVDAAGGKAPDGSGAASTAERARRWFVAQFPLLGSLASGFKIIEDGLLCTRMQISVAAVSAEDGEVYMNPAAALDEHECRFVMAHELLHVGLGHHGRRRGRDAYLWNVACDYVINDWLIDMGVGTIPRFGGLYDPELKGLSAESVYDRLTGDLRRYRKLATFRGVGLGDLLDAREPDWWSLGAGCTLDEFYRRCLAQGLSMHVDAGRGLLPAGLVEEIRALAQPAIPWDVELARWFDDHFAPVEHRRTYARASRRQSATPDIPRPRVAPVEAADDGRTFAVVLDTSGSMDRNLLARALGAIASYSTSRDVPAVRLVFCDAVAHDVGYVSPDDIAGRVRVRGRGGTVLQPGVDRVEHAEDFPKDGPILVITDGLCDRVRIRRRHAFLVPEGARLPFPPVGPVFRLR